jgi:hypothetical protein
MDFRNFLEEKSWKAKRDDILELWRNVRPYLPIEAEVVPARHKGTRYRYDGVRITGRPKFINSILSRLKDFLRHEGQPGVRLDIEYEQIETKEGSILEGPRFVCYIHLMES